MENLAFYAESEPGLMFLGTANLICVIIISAKIFKRKIMMSANRALVRLKRTSFGISIIDIILCYLRFCNSGRVKYLKFSSRVICVVRASRAFLFLRAHKTLFEMQVFSRYVAPQVEQDLFHHLSRRYYLAKNLNLSERVNFVLSHYSVEERFFDIHYKKEVYSRNGLILWENIVSETNFRIVLKLGDRYAAEGDLCVALMVDGERLHAISFSWLRNALAHDSDISIFIGLNQGRWRKDEEFHNKFSLAFPNNAANFICYAALQGIARAVGARSMIGVSSELQVCSSSKEKPGFDNAYDEFWRSQGGVASDKHGFILPVPCPRKDLSTLPAKHRKRAANRRLLLDAVEARTFETLSKHLLIFLPSRSEAETLRG